MQSNRYVLIAIIIGVLLLSASFIYIKRPSIDSQDNEGTQTPDQEPDTEPEPEQEPTPTTSRSTVNSFVQGYLIEVSSQISNEETETIETAVKDYPCLLYTSPSPRD